MAWDSSKEEALHIIGIYDSKLCLNKLKDCLSLNGWNQSMQTNQLAKRMNQPLPHSIPLKVGILTKT